MGANKNYSLIFIAILAAALVLRFYNFPAWQGFDYDQEVNAWIAKTILVDHKPVLIGPQTSVGGMFVGPYFNYVIAAFFLVSHMDPTGTIVLNLIIATTTIILVYLAAARVFSPRAGLFAAIIYSFSSFLSTYDRVLWNPTPIPLVSIGVVFSLWLYLIERRQRYLALAVGLVGFMFHLHFSAVFVLGFLGLALGLFAGRRVLFSGKNYLMVGSILLLFFLPLIIFDWRHQFLNSSHLVKFFFSGETHNGSLGDVVFNFSKMVSDLGVFVASVAGQGLGDAAKYWGIILLGGFFLGVWQEKEKRRRLFLQLTAILILVVVVGLSFYRGALPSYYFFLPLSSLVVVAGYFLDRFWMKKYFLVALGLFVGINVLQTVSAGSVFALRYKEQAVRYIVSDARGAPLAVDFVADLGLNTGFKYLFWQALGKDLPDVAVVTKRYKIVVPATIAQPWELTRQFGAIGVVKYL